MLYGLYASASGVIAASHRQDVHANNLANIESTGFKRTLALVQQRPAEAVEFYEGLVADNSKTYWQDHKPVYDTCVRAPMEALLAELAAEFGQGRLFRPHRDVRFSADKSPYKTHIGAMIGDLAYVQVSADGLGVGRGMYMMAADQLDRYRFGRWRFPAQVVAVLLDQLGNNIVYR